MSAPWKVVDDAVEQWLMADPSVVTFTRHDLAAELGCSPSHASELLQQHRVAQNSGTTRYVVAARGYARSAMWFILAAPGKPGSGRRRRLTMGHVEYVAIDAARRVISDISTEIDPAVVHHPSIKAYLQQAQSNLEGQVRSTVASINAAVALVESVNREKADRTNTATL